MPIRPDPKKRISEVQQLSAAIKAYEEARSALRATDETVSTDHYVRLEQAAKLVERESAALDAKRQPHFEKAWGQH